MKNILIIVNKSWEVDPVISALTASKIKPDGFPYPTVINLPFPKKKEKDETTKPPEPTCRAIIEITQTKIVEEKKVTETMKVTVWCIEDIMRTGSKTSSSQEKAERMPPIIFDTEKDVDLVIAFGTAGFNDRLTSFNGSIVVGSEFFSFNAKTENSESDFKNELLGKHLKTNVDEKTNKAIFEIFNDKFKDIVESKLIATPNKPAEKSKILAAANYVAVSNVNLTNYNDYAWADEAGIAAYHATRQKSPIGSIETTHGIIRLCTTLPTIFVSAISDRLGYFGSEVNPSQNFVASFNGGIFLSYLIPALINIK